MLKKVNGSKAIMAMIFGVMLILGVAGAAERLGSYNIDKNGISVSGISAGGYIAQQYHVAHSDSIMGAGILAAGPYRCAGSTFWPPVLAGMGICSSFLPVALGSPDVQRMIGDTYKEAEKGTIDKPENMRNDKVWLFSGTNDEKVPQSVVDALHTYYLEFIDGGNIFYKKDIPAAHAMITDDFGNTCDAFEPPYINDCDYDAAGLILQHIYGELKGKVIPDSNQIIEFVQTEFFDKKDESVSMNKVGYVYVPKACADGGNCRLHIAFHGCRQDRDEVGDDFYADAGYNEWAETNNIIVLYPQNKKWGVLSFEKNPQGCWDWWGYSGKDFYNKTGKQIAAVEKMINRLIGE